MLYPLDDTLPMGRCFICPQTNDAYSRHDSQVPDGACVPAVLCLADVETPQMRCTPAANGDASCFGCFYD